MKTLMLLRHAKSSWDDWSLADHDRPLAPRGRNAAPRMARMMVERQTVPELVLCSTAVRARETWELMAPVLPEPVDVQYVEALYGATPRGMLEVVARLAGDRSPVLLVGHNPGMEDLAHALASSGPQEAMRTLRVKYPTAALAVLDLDVDSWSDVTSGAGTLRHFIRPKDL
jgi:phosphohistidine phosphatase